MLSKNLALKDKRFLDKLFAEKVKNHYAKICLLDFQTENFYSEYVGKVTGGSVTYSASSAVRATCSLTIVADDSNNDLTNINNEISVNKKFALYVGYENTIKDYEHYGDIIWFPLGIFLFVTVSFQRSSSGTTISVTGKDKMSLLDGEIAGDLTANTTFHEQFMTKEDGSLETSKPTIFTIIKEIVNNIGNESLNNIIINDVPNQIKQVMIYNGIKPLYYGRDSEGQYKFSLNSADIQELEKTYQPQEKVGYTYVDFVYPGELTMKAGSNAANVLQTIQKKLGNYEFFYNRDGKFVFQEIKNYLNTSYVPIHQLSQDNFITNFGESSKSVYRFENSDLVISYSTSPQFGNIRNDFWVWGQRGEKNKDLTALCYHIAIDEKPVPRMHDVIVTSNEEDGINQVRIAVDGDSADPEKNEIYFSDMVPNDWRYELLLRDLETEAYGGSPSFYYAELIAFFPKLYDFKNNKFFDYVTEKPEELTYFLDFIDTDSSVGEFSVKNIGRRSKAVTEQNISLIYQKDVEDIIIINRSIYDKETLDMLLMEYDLKGQKYALVDEDLYNLFTEGVSSHTAYDEIRQMVQQYTSYSEPITLSTMPIFYLELNERISVVNPQTGINGDYIIQTLSMPLAANGQMTLTASKATSRL